MLIDLRGLWIVVLSLVGLRVSRGWRREVRDRDMVDLFINEGHQSCSCFNTFLTLFLSMTSN